MTRKINWTRIYANIYTFFEIKLPKIKRRRVKEIRREVRPITCKLRCSEPWVQFTREDTGIKKVLQVLLSLPVIKRTTLRSFFSPESSTINRHVPSFLNSLKSSGQRGRRIFVPRKLLFSYTLFHSTSSFCRVSR